LTLRALKKLHQLYIFSEVLYVLMPRFALPDQTKNKDFFILACITFAVQKSAVGKNVTEFFQG